MSAILIAGCGDIGTALGLELAAAGHRVWGLRRQPEQLPMPLEAIGADLAHLGDLPRWPARFGQVFYTAAADGPDADAYRTAYVDGLCNLVASLVEQGQRPSRLFFTSSVGVYGQCEGEWVDEGSVTEPSHATGGILLEAEAVAREAPFPATVVRLAGIYGPGRTRLLDGVREGREHCSGGPAVYTNRIHRDDCAGLLAHLSRIEHPLPLYVGVDDEPAERCAVLHWLAERLGTASPHRETAGLATRKRGSNKRCRDDRIKASGYALRYPTFREGYAALIDGEPG